MHIDSQSALMVVAFGCVITIVIFFTEGISLLLIIIGITEIRHTTALKAKYAEFKEE
jgi:hypothetical protein